jgi:superfamily II DNA or RNA helicase
MTFTPSPHLWLPQRRAVESVIDAYTRGKSVCLYSPTGSGKTTVAAELLRWCHEGGVGGVFYINRKLLIGQTSSRFTAAGLPHGIRAADYEDRWQPSEPIQIASIDTERARVEKSSRWTRHDVAGGLVIVDEAHIQKSESMWNAIQEYKAAGAQIILLTATPIGLSSWVDELIVAGRLQEFRDCKAIVPAVVYSIEQPDLRKVKRREDGEYEMNGELKKRYVQQIVGRVYENWKGYNPDARPALLYAPGKDESVWLTEQFERHGVPWAHVDATDAVVDGKRAKLTRDVWDEILGRFKDGSIKGLSSRFKLREGVDVPFAYHCILATPIGSLASYIQTVGRVLRYSPETPDHVIITDHGGCLDYDTEVLTDHGWRNHRTIDDHDLLAAYDRNTGEVSWEPILSRHNRLLEPGEMMYSIQSRCLDIRVTGNHRLLTKRRQYDGGRNTWGKSFALERADSIGRGRFKIPASGRQIAKGVDLTDDEIEFLGWWITDGNLHRRGSVERLTICQADHTPYVHQLRDCIRRCGFDWTELTQKYRDGSGKTCTVFFVPKGTCKSRPRRGWAERLGPYLDKDLSPLLEDLDERQFAIFLHAIHMGDGAKDRGRGSYRIACGNRIMADRLQSLCVRRGWKCNISELTSDRKNTLFTININKSSDMCVHGPGTPTSDNQAALEASPPAPGERVWCVANRLETIITRRNGKVAVIGNSYLHHGSPNDDRDWHSWWTLPERAVSEMHSNQIRDKEIPEPICCPKCKGERKTGPNCPHRCHLCHGVGCSGCGGTGKCGFVAAKSRRHVLMEDGTLKARNGKLVRPKRVAVKSNTQALWDKMYWGYRNGKNEQTFSQMAGFFAHQHGYSPPKNLRNMPKSAADWYRKVRDVPREALK